MFSTLLVRSKAPTSAEFSTHFCNDLSYSVMRFDIDFVFDIFRFWVISGALGTSIFDPFGLMFRSFFRYRFHIVFL